MLIILNRYRTIQSIDHPKIDSWSCYSLSFNMSKVWKTWFGQACLHLKESRKGCRSDITVVDFSTLAFATQLLENLSQAMEAFKEFDSLRMYQKIRRSNLYLAPNKDGKEHYKRWISDFNGPIARHDRTILQTARKDGPDLATIGKWIDWNSNLVVNARDRTLRLDHFQL